MAKNNLFLPQFTAVNGTVRILTAPPRILFEKKNSDSYGWCAPQTGWGEGSRAGTQLLDPEASKTIEN